MVGRTTISGRGVVTSRFGSGLGIEKNRGNVGFAPYPSTTGSIISSAVTLTAGQAGVNIISGTGEGVSGIVMPTADSSAGAMFIFSNGGGVQTHTLTGSQEGDGVLVFSDGTNHGSQLTFDAGLGDQSVALVSDGVNFIVVGSSGSISIAGL